jgi:hypothetical protein
MNRFVLIALLLFQSTVLLCQSQAAPPDSSQAPGKRPTVQWPFDFGVGQPAQAAPKLTFKNFDCHGLSTAQNQASPPIDLDHLFNATCADSNSHAVLFAFNEKSVSRSPFVVPPHPNIEPIPTQWPNAKCKQIPTQWPNLKLQPIDGISPGLVPAHGSAK